MTVGYRRCVSIPINYLWSETQLRTKCADLHHVKGRVVENKVRVLELNVSRKFALMKPVLLDVNSTQSTVCFSSSNIDKRFWITNCFMWIAKGYRLLCTVVFQWIFKLKVYTLNKLKNINFFLQIYCQVLVERFRFWANCTYVVICASRMDWTTT